MSYTFSSNAHVFPAYLPASVGSVEPDLGGLYFDYTMYGRPNTDSKYCTTQPALSGFHASFIGSSRTVNTNIDDYPSICQTTSVPGSSESRRLSLPVVLQISIDSLCQSCADRLLTRFPTIFSEQAYSNVDVVRPSSLSEDVYAPVSPADFEECISKEDCRFETQSTPRARTPLFLSPDSSISTRSLHDSILIDSTPTSLRSSHNDAVSSNESVPMKRSSMETSSPQRGDAKRPRVETASPVFDGIHAPLNPPSANAFASKDLTGRPHSVVLSSSLDSLREYVSCSSDEEDSAEGGNYQNQQHHQTIEHSSARDSLCVSPTFQQTFDYGTCSSSVAGGGLPVLNDKLTSHFSPLTQCSFSSHSSALTIQLAAPATLNTPDSVEGFFCDQVETTPSAARLTLGSIYPSGCDSDSDPEPHGSDELGSCSESSGSHRNSGDISSPEVLNTSSSPTMFSRSLKRILSDSRSESDESQSSRAQFSSLQKSTARTAVTRMRARVKQSSASTSYSSSHARVAWPRLEMKEPVTTSALLGMMIEALAAGRPAAQTVANLYAHVAETYPSLPSERSVEEWIGIFRRLLQHGADTYGMFGKIERDSVAMALPCSPDREPTDTEPLWYYIPAKDIDRERGEVMRLVMQDQRIVSRRYRDYRLRL
ncbi:hypothetical protein FISHEDRAFT_68902 [Fistulina hepatica ATCC 64428]|uniref:Uncharacterized protein n=1 Tax=Fistulina hepatica ATCC 64428 TaxID=1128425 RepID=A0A0D7AQ36_9AGAR|nr:hypothetical protein FISHEDRAFT_68902 [Fistulina hepatica ATCC 64428]